MVGVREPLRRAEHGVTHLVVVDPRSARPMAMLSTLDIARVVAGD
jgi:hypothetical protein